MAMSRLEELRRERSKDRVLYAKVLRDYMDTIRADGLRDEVAELLADFLLADSIDQVTEAVEEFALELNLPDDETTFKEEFASELEEVAAESDE